MTYSRNKILSKILITLICLTSLNSFAKDRKNNLKTEGHYVGIDFVRTKTWYNVVQYYDDELATYYPSHVFYPASRETSEGFGFNYKYALNKNNFFIAPEVFLEFNSIGSNKAKGDGTGLQIKKRYGAKVNLGYDVPEIFSPYVFAGYSYIETNTKMGNWDISDENFLTASQRNKNREPLFGFGIIKHINKNYSMSLEYSRQKFKAEGPLPEGGYWATYQYLRSKIEVIKLGVSYNF